MSAWNGSGYTGGTYTNSIFNIYNSTGFTITNSTFINTLITTTIGTTAGWIDHQTFDIHAAFDARLQVDNVYILPDGARLRIDDKGNYTIEDKDAKVIYQASRIRDFNQYLNASDMLEQYIEELVPHGIRQDQVLGLRIEHFIHWLIHKAAEKDSDPIPQDIPRLPPSTPRFHNERCNTCARFISKRLAASKMFYCSIEHFNRHLEKLNVKEKIDTRIGRAHRQDVRARSKDRCETSRIAQVE